MSHLSPLSPLQLSQIDQASDYFVKNALDMHLEYATTYLPGYKTPFFKTNDHYITQLFFKEPYHKKEYFTCCSDPSYTLSENSLFVDSLLKTQAVNLNLFKQHVDQRPSASSKQELTSFCQSVIEKFNASLEKLKERPFASDMKWSVRPIHKRGLKSFLNPKKAEILGIELRTKDEIKAPLPLVLVALPFFLILWSQKTSS